MTAPAIGPRQTVDRACHPTLGEGRAVHRNGPSFFIADSGEVEEYVSLDWIGSGVGPPPYSHMRGVRADKTKILLDTHGRASGEHHWRVMRQTGVRGWLVDVGRSEFGWAHRWEPDEGESSTFYVSSMWVGEREDGKSKNGAPKMCPWFTLKHGAGHFVWCHERDADKAVAWVRPAKRRKGKKPSISTGEERIDYLSKLETRAWHKALRGEDLEKLERRAANSTDGGVESAILRGIEMGKAERARMTA
jgi:hypothetical protein